MRIFTVTCNRHPLAMVRAGEPAEAIEIARELTEGMGFRGVLQAREPEDAEMVSWLERRDDHLLAPVSLAEAS